MNVDQATLDFELCALPGAGAVRGSANGRQARAGRRGVAPSHGPYSCSGCTALWIGDCTAHCAACHSSFSTVGLFDAHRSLAGDAGTCRGPATLIHRAGERAGERVMFWRDGLWHAPRSMSFDPAARADDQAR
ncbi:MAG: hypothetical protein ACRDS0_29990 [Pseudonocardiaceae bacterium]